MIKLICLEMRKNNVSKYALYALICIVLITAFVLAIDFSWGFEEADVIAGEAPPITFIAEMMTGIVFLVMAGIMHAAFTVGAYKNRTIDLMFSYPIKRRKILISKILAVLIFNFFALLIAQGILYGAIYVASHFLTPAYAMNYDFASATTYAIIAAKSAMTVCISILSLFIGMLKKSSVATIVSSFMLVMLLQGSIGTTSLLGSVIFPIVIIVIAFGFAAVIISGVEKKDIC